MARVLDCATTPTEIYGGSVVTERPDFHRREQLGYFRSEMRVVHR